MFWIFLSVIVICIFSLKKHREKLMIGSVRNISETKAADLNKSISRANNIITNIQPFDFGQVSIMYIMERNRTVANIVNLDETKSFTHSPMSITRIKNEETNTFSINLLPEHTSVLNISVESVSDTDNFLRDLFNNLVSKCFERIAEDLINENPREEAMDRDLVILDGYEKYILMLKDLKPAALESRDQNICFQFKENSLTIKFNLQNPENINDKVNLFYYFESTPHGLEVSQQTVGNPRIQKYTIYSPEIQKRMLLIIKKLIDSYLI